MRLRSVICARTVNRSGSRSRHRSPVIPPAFPHIASQSSKISTTASSPRRVGRRTRRNTARSSTSLVDAIAVIDESAVIQSFNRSAENIFGYPAAEVVGRNIRLLMPEPDRSKHDGYIANYRRTGQAKIIGIGREVQGRRNDGSLFSLELSIAEWCADGRRYFTGIMRDVTDRKQADEALRRLNETLERRVD